MLLLWKMWCDVNIVLLNKSVEAKIYRDDNFSIECTFKIWDSKYWENILIENRHEQAAFNWDVINSESE